MKKIMGENGKVYKISSKGKGGIVYFQESLFPEFKFALVIRKHSLGWMNSLICRQKNGPTQSLPCVFNTGTDPNTHLFTTSIIKDFFKVLILCGENLNM